MHEDPHIVHTELPWLGSVVVETESPHQSCCKNISLSVNSMSTHKEHHVTSATSSYIRPHEMGGQEHTEGEHNNRDIIGESMIRQHTHEVVLQYHWLSYYVEKKRERVGRDKEMESKKTKS